MKTLIVTIAITLLYAGFLVYQQDNNRYLRELEILKHAADEASASASLYYDAAMFAEGDKIFNQAEGRKAIEFILRSYLNLDEYLMPLDNTYWQDRVTYNVYFIDQKYLDQYDEDANFPYLFRDELTGYVKTITEPTVIVTVNAGRPRYRLSFLSPNDAIRSSCYEYVGR